MPWLSSIRASAKSAMSLPDGAEDPAIEVLRADSPYASFYLALSVPEGESRSSDMADLVQRDILPRLSSVPDVQNAIKSGIRPAMRIWLDTARMAALGVSASDIQHALRENNVISTLGALKTASSSIDLVSNTEAGLPKTLPISYSSSDADRRYPTERCCPSRSRLGRGHAAYSLQLAGRRLYRHLPDTRSQRNCCRRRPVRRGRAINESLG